MPGQVRGALSANLYHVVPGRPCTPLEGPFLHDNLLLDAAPFPASLNRDLLGGRVAPVWLLHVEVSRGSLLRPLEQDLHLEQAELDSVQFLRVISCHFFKVL